MTRIRQGYDRNPDRILGIFKMVWFNEQSFQIVDNPNQLAEADPEIIKKK